MAQNHQWFGQQTLPMYTDSFKLYLHWQSFIAITPAPPMCNSHYSTCLSHLGQHDTDMIISIIYHAAQGCQGKYSSECLISLSPMVLLTHFANINDPLHYGKNRAELVGFKNAKYIFFSLKPTSLAQFLS